MTVTMYKILNWRIIDLRLDSIRHNSTFWQENNFVLF